MPDGPTYAYTYDDNDRLTHLTIPGVGDITYPSYTLNRPDSVTFPGGSNQSYTYDALMRLEQIVSSPSGMDYQYTSYDGVSNILTKSTEHGNYVYDYDDMYRLTDVDNPTLDDEVYTYDGVGNRLTSADVIGNWSYNQNNELLGYADVEYTYDENGNMTQKRVGTAAVNYIYDAANRLVKVEDEASGTVIAEYFYDPFGRRLWKDVNGEKTYFLYADEGLVAEYDENDVKIRSYGYKPDSMGTTNPLFLKQGGQYYWYQNDHLGTPQKLIDINGTVVWSAQYNSFGEAVVDVEIVTNNLRFPGQYYDDETGLHYNWFRYYDPRVGRYLKKDPIGFVGGDINLYAYVWNNPVNETDPFGLQGGPAEAAIAGIGTCLATLGCREALIAGTFLGSVALCRALGGCQSLPVDEPLWLPPMAPPISPTIPGSYPEIRPISPFFPQIRPISSFFPPIPLICEDDGWEIDWPEGYDLPWILPGGKLDLSKLKAYKGLPWIPPGPEPTPPGPGARFRKCVRDCRAKYSAAICYPFCIVETIMNYRL